MRLFLFSLVMLANPALAQDRVTAAKPESVVAQMLQAGLQAKLETDGSDEPMITSGAAGANFSVFFYGCTDKKDCTAVQFSACFTLDKPASLEVINAFNTDKRYAKGDLDKDNDACLRMDINLVGDGVNSDNFQDSISTWTVQLGAFMTAIGYN
jgi:hypothetical protein